MVVADILARLRRYWAWGLLAFVVGGVAGYASTWLRTPIYQADTILTPAARNTTTSGLAQLLAPLPSAARASLSLGDDSSLSERALVIIRSRAFTEKFVQANDLVDLLWQPSTLDKLLKRPPPSERRKLFDAALLFRTAISTVRVDARTGFVTISVRWSDPIAAARWANLLAEAINEEARARAIVDADNAIAFLQNELHEQSTIAIQNAINQLIDGQLNNKMLAETRPQFVYTVLAPALDPLEGDYVSPDRPLTALVVAVLSCALALVVIARGRL